jgi:hypothetical protein
MKDEKFFLKYLVKIPNKIAWHIKVGMSVSSMNTLMTDMVTHLHETVIKK